MLSETCRRAGRQIECGRGRAPEPSRIYHELFALESRLAMYVQLALHCSEL